MNTWTPPEKPTDLAESRLIQAILEDVYPINSFLPSERELCEQLGVTRPTLREALQRMRRDGWVEIHQGKKTRVRDYLHEGNLNVLNAMAGAEVQYSLQIIENLLQVRYLLAPTYFKEAAQKNPQKLRAKLESLLPFDQDPELVGKNDWQLHKTAADLSMNPVFLLILNGFDEVYLQMAGNYFSQERARTRSQVFYQDLINAIQQKSFEKIYDITQQMMQDSIALFEQSIEQ